MGSVDELKKTLNRMVNEHYNTPEIIHFNSFPMTVERGKILMIHRVPFTINRRSCWAAVQSSSPVDVKRLIWEHEKDELIVDPRFGGDHQSAEVGKAIKLTGWTTEEIYQAELIPGCKAALCAWLYLAHNSSWIKAFSASAVLERANNNAIVKGGGSSIRDYRRYTDELRKLIGDISGHDVHNVADEDHSDTMEVALDHCAGSKEAKQQALEGARDSLDFDRAFRGSLAASLEKIS